MDTTQKATHNTCRALLQLPEGSRFPGSLKARGARALLFIGDDGVAANWGDDAEGRIFLAQPDGKSGVLQTTVALNGISGHGRGLDLTLTGDLKPGVLNTLKNLQLSPYGKPEARRLLARIIDENVDRLQDSLQLPLAALGDQLFELATAPRNKSDERQQFYDALSALKRSGNTLRREFAKRVSSCMARPDKLAGETVEQTIPRKQASLGLVEFAEMEVKLATEHMVRDALNLYGLELESLALRVGDLLGLGANQVKTPFHPLYLCRSFEESLQTLGFAAMPLQQSLLLLHRLWIKRLHGFFAAVNSDFAAAGLRPGLEEELQSFGSIMARTSEHNPGAWRRETEDSQPEERVVAGEQQQQVSGVSAANPAAHDAGARPKGYAPQEEAAGEDSGQPRENRDIATTRERQVYQALRNAQIIERQTLAHRASEIANDSALEVTGKPIDPAAAADLLSRLQEAAAPPDGSGNALSGTELLSRQGFAPGEETASRLSVVDDVYRTIESSIDMNPQLTSAMQTLRIPLSRLSLREPTFFADADHPAHRVLDKLSRMARAENFPNPALAKKLSQTVEKLVAAYQNDSSAFAAADDQLSQLLKQQQAASGRNTQRVISSMEGQDKLRSARNAVNHLLSEYIHPPDAPQPILDLLDAGWRDLLTQIAVREGTGSREWETQSATLGTLFTGLERAASGESNPALTGEFRELLRQLGLMISTVQPGNVSHEQPLSELLDVASGRRPLEIREVSASPGSEEVPITQERLQSLPRLRRWISRVAELQLGTVMSYLDREGFRRRLRLVWISEDKERYAFVNDLGKKVAEMSRLQLARRLSQGMKPQDAVDQMSVLGQTVYDSLTGAQEKLGKDLTRDEVTPLASYVTMSYQLARSVQHAQKHDTEHAFICLDIDAFHLVNEFYEGVDGELILSEFARILARFNERRALSARLEGDIFGVLLAHRDGKEALALAERIREEISTTSLSIGNEEITFTASIGIAPVIRTTRSAGDVMQQAKTALELARERGGNRCVVFEERNHQLRAYDRDRIAARQLVENALAEDRLILRAQPIVRRTPSDESTDLKHYEMLLSLRRDDNSLATPGEFIASAERFGFMTEIDRWVVRKVCSWISDLMDSQKQVPEVAINLCGASLTDDNFTEYVLEQISEFGVGTSKLCFEITETGAIENLTKAADFIRTLRNIGCSFALDDFGTGLASYNYLRELPVDYVKIDGTFVREIHERDNDYAMVRSINDLAHFLGQETIAECVESMDVMGPLHDIGVDYFQGWGIGMPRSLEEVGEELPALET